jgi:hypothetical protein
MIIMIMIIMISKSWLRIAPAAVDDSAMALVQYMAA